MSPIRSVLGLLALTAALATPSLAQSASRWPTDILRETFGLTPASPMDARFEDLRQGCPRRDCIPSIDRPEFVAARDASFLEDGDLVLGFELGGVERAYPIFLLDRHEIVNDRVGDQAVAITWCPLCGSGLALRRVLDGEAVEFGVSGLLRDDDLILYDRASESLWQQITATAFAGPRRGRKLETLPVATTTWGAWRTAHPQTEVLASRDDAGRLVRLSRPYGDYDDSERLLFPVRHPNDLAHPKTVVHGVEVDGRALAVSERRLRAQGRAAASVGGVEIAVVRDADGQVRATRIADGTELPVHRMFWFAWATFHPGTTLLDAEGADRRRP